MDLQELYRRLKEGIREGRLTIDGIICDGVFNGIFLAAGSIDVLDCTINLLLDSLVIRGRCGLNGWNAGGDFHVEITCREFGKKIGVNASFWCGYNGTLGGFFGNVAPCLVREADGSAAGTTLVSDFPISMPVLAFDTMNENSYYPFSFQAAAKKPHDSRWEIYASFLTGIRSMSGLVNKYGEFEMEVPLSGIVSAVFPLLGMGLLLNNGAEYEESFYYPVISQVGLKLRLSLPEVSEADFTVPLFEQDNGWSLSAYFPDGFGIADIVNFVVSLFGIGGSASGLFLPQESALDQFRLYRMNLLVDREGNSLSIKQVLMEFALSSPWKLPIPHVTLESLNAGFQASFGMAAAHDGNYLLTAGIGGMLSVELGRYQLRMALEMDLPGLDFSAQMKLEAQDGEGPGLEDLASSLHAKIPEFWNTGKNLLGQITIHGSGSSRSFNIEAGVYNILSFSIGSLRINLAQLSVSAEITTSCYRFILRGLLEFGEGNDLFSLYLTASYENPGWVFAGGLYQGMADIGKLLGKMFQIASMPEDVASLRLTEFEIAYATLTGVFELTAAFEAGWNVTLLGKKLILGGRVLISQKEEGTDVSALAYLSLGDFRVLVQVDHLQARQLRNYLFRVEYGKVYLQAAWFYREYEGNREEILAVSLGGMTLGGLVETIVGMINPNRKFTLDAPWSLLNKIELDKFLFELNATRNQASFLYQAKLEITGLMYLDTVGLRYDMDRRKVFFVLTGKLLGTEYSQDNPIMWDALDGKPPADSADNEKKFALFYLGFGQHLKNDGIEKADGIREAVQALKGQITPAAEQGEMPAEIACDAGVNWLFGADFTINGMLNIKLVLNDPVLYGLLVTVKAKPGSALEAFDGFGIELLYRRVSSQVYMFRGELLVPVKYRTFQLGAVSLTLGTIRIEIYTNGGFYADLGFPHHMDFSSSFMLEWGIFTGRGGIYFGVTKNVGRPHVPKAVNGSFSPVIELGIGLSVGLGRSFDLGIIKGGVSLEVFGIFEGVLAIFHEKETGKEHTYYYVKATAGITGRLYLSVDLKIITIQASALVAASAQLTLQAYRKTRVELDLSMKLKASIKILFIKIKFSFSFHEHVEFEMGSDERAPWIEEGGNTFLKAGVALPAISALQVETLETRHISIELVPLFYLDRPALDPEAKKTYGAAFLMTMDTAALKQWTGLLTDWILSPFPGEAVRWQEAEALKEGLADTLRYEVLEEFLKQNVFLSYSIRWTCREAGMLSLEEAVGEEKEGYIFPILPSLKVSFGSAGMEKEVRYWEDTPVDEAYFTGLTEYFRELNADPSCKEQGSAAVSGLCAETRMPIAKAFFQDYFRMFIRELTGRIKGLYKQCSTDIGIVAASKKFQVPLEQLLLQNPGLEFSYGIRLVFPQLQYVVKEADTIEEICKRFEADKNKVWDSLKQETYLLRQGSRLYYGEGTYQNPTGLNLKEAAAMLFVRFFAESAPEDTISAGEIVRANEDLIMGWEETVPEGRRITLPGREEVYTTLRGDNPARLGSWLRLLKMKPGSLPEWERFYQDIRTKNPQAQEIAPGEICFAVPEISVWRDLNLLELSARIYPDYGEEDAPRELLFTSHILKANTPVMICDVICQTGEGPAATVDKVRRGMECSIKELAAAVTSDDLFKTGQTLLVQNAALVEKQWITDHMQEEAETVGAMLSRFLLQGLRVSDPLSAGQDRNENALIPLYQALQQQFVLKEEGREQILTVVSQEPGCIWVETGEKQVHLPWEQISEELPDGDFSALPEKFVQLDDFVASDQRFTVPKAAVWLGKQGCLTIHCFTEAMQEVLHSGNIEPELVDEDGTKEVARWGCLLPFGIGLCAEEGIFSVNGADAVQRLALHELLGLENVHMHLLFQASEVSKGEPNFHEYVWDLQGTFLAKTNLSLETHMEPLSMYADGSKEYLSDLTEPPAFMRLLWECSTVGGGGYYLKLQTVDGQTLPNDIFEEDGTGTLWLLIEETDYAAVAPWVNCGITADTIGSGKTMMIVTKDPRQQVLRPEFPAGCIGLAAYAAAVGEEDDSPSAAMQRLFSIVGYQLGEMPGVYRESHLSAPVVPMEKDGAWVYSPVIPVYRYAERPEDNIEDNPYHAVGKAGNVLLEIRDVLGNSVKREAAEFIPCYNDECIGIGQWAATRISYSLTGSPERPLLRLSFEPSLPERWKEETVKQQRKAVWQLECKDIEVELTSPVNNTIFRFSEINKGDTDYLELLRCYGRKLADYLEGRLQEGPEAFDLDFSLDLQKRPLYENIFELRTMLTVKRAEILSSSPAAEKSETIIRPWVRQPAGSRENYGNGGEPVNLQPFCREAMRVLPELVFAQKGSGETGIYGMTYKEDGFLEKIEILPIEYTCEENGGHTVRAPEFYALRPLHNGYISRSAKIRVLSNNKLFEGEIQSVDIPEVDMEIWALGFLEDMEKLLMPEYVRKAGVICRSELNRLISAKDRLAGAIAQQMTPLRQGAAEAGAKLKGEMADRLKRSLKDGYRSDVAAACRLVMKAKEPCRLTVTVKENTANATVTAGKADTSCNEIYLYFDNCLNESSEPLSFNVVLPELEYAISQDGGYESSSWLKFVEPVEPVKPAGQDYTFSSQLDLPNPLKLCPRAPVMTNHTCEIGFDGNEAQGSGRFAEDSAGVGWDYRLELKYNYMQQDTLFISIAFEDIGSLEAKAGGQDLFDVLAEYSMVRDKIYEGLSLEDESIYRNAYLSFAEIGENAGDVWEDWLHIGTREVAEYKNREEMVYSCYARGIKTESGLRFVVDSTAQGQEFLDRLGLQIPVLEDVDSPETDGKNKLVFIMEHLPLYRCAQAVPSVKAVRNQNLLYDRKAGSYLRVREEFIYRTQEVSMPALQVAGDYTKEYVLGTINARDITRQVMEQAAGYLFEKLQLENIYLQISLGVSWYYGLSSGKEQPRVLLPVTFLPIMDTADETGKSGRLIANVGGNIYDWYREVRPDGNCSGLIFDLKVYQKKGKRQILHFSKLLVRIIP